MHRPGTCCFLDSTLVAQRFDSDLSGPIGDPVPIAQNFTDPLAAEARRSPCPTTGCWRIGRFPVDPQAPVVRLARAQPLGTIGPFPFEDFGAAELSPDGTQIAMHRANPSDEDTHIWLFDLTQRQPRQLTFSAGADRRPMWSPDGRRLLFVSRRPGASGLYQKPVGGEPEELLLPSPTDGRVHLPTDWSSKGIVYESGSDRFDFDLWILPIDGDRKPYSVVREPGA